MFLFFHFPAIALGLNAGISPEVVALVSYCVCGFNCPSRSEKLLCAWFLHLCRSVWQCQSRSVWAAQYKMCVCEVMRSIMKVDIMWECKQTESLINNNLYDWSLARFCTQVDIALISGKYIKILFKRRNWKPRDKINKMALWNLKVYE